MNINSQFPIFIVSKGRYEIRMTSDALSKLKVKHHIVIEKQEYDLYREHTKGNSFVELVILDKKFQDEYKVLDDLGDSKSKGPGAARNFVWDYSMKAGYSHHWVMDDNIRDFYSYNKNRRKPIKDSKIFNSLLNQIENVACSYSNVYMSGMNYVMFVPDKQKCNPYTLNTRIYSCNFIRNDIPFRWRGRYNEDTILSLDILAKGFCTLQFNVLLQQKITTQKLGGGNTKEFYAEEGTYPKSKMLIDVYPQYCKMVHRFGRIHHFCNYQIFKNKLKKCLEVKRENQKK